MSRQTDNENVLEITESKWFKRREMANHLGVSTRTLCRMVNRGDVLKRDSERGMLYRPAPELLENEGQKTTDSTAAKSTDTTDSGGGDRRRRQKMAAATDISVSAEKWGELHRKIGQLEEKSARMSELEEQAGEVLELAKKLARAEAKLEGIEDLRAELRRSRETATEFRAKYHLAEGRRELAEERLKDRDERIEELEAEVTDLRERLEEPGDKKSTWSLF
jgi:chromosome segregation ATPase